MNFWSRVFKLNLPEESIHLWQLKLMNPKKDMQIVKDKASEILKEYKTLNGEVKRAIASGIVKLVYNSRKDLTGDLL